MEVRELQHRPATTCMPTTPLSEVARLMRDDHVGSVVVVTEHGQVCGIVTDRDLVARAMAEHLASHMAVEQVMSRNVITVYENADALTAASEMAQEGIRRLPVLDTQGHLTGVVSFDDLVVTFADHLGRLALAARKEIQRAVLPA